MFLELGPHDGLAYHYQAPSRKDAPTLVCFNPLTGDRGMWETGVGPALIAHGCGLLTWNLRGQTGSPFTPSAIHQDNIVSDCGQLLRHVKPRQPLFVGLSVGGLYAAQVHLGQQGYPCHGLVLINTLREIGPRLAWVNQALVRLAETGGLELLRDIYSPLLLGEDWLARNRGDFLKTGGYQPLPRSEGAWQLLKAGENTLWNVHWSNLDVPVLNITGLQDHVFRDDQVIARLLPQFKDVKAIEYADAGHMIPAEAPERLARDILNFISSR